MSEVVLIRPGCTAFDEQERIQGDLDLPLSERGREQLQQILDELRSNPPEIVYSSPCEPARSTAAAIGREFHVAVKELEDLRNLHFGLWQGLPQEEIRRKYPRVFKQWEDSPESVCPPEGETIEEVRERMREALRKPLRKKARFAVVAPEPLATLIADEIRQVRTGDELPVCGHAEEAKLIEIVRTPDGGEADVPDGPFSEDRQDATAPGGSAR